MNIDELQAGQELDELVAEALGEPKPPDSELPDFESAFCLWLDGRPFMSKGGNWMCATLYEHNDEPEWIPLLFSSNIGAAWRGLEQFPAYAVSHSHDGYQCRIYTDKMISRGEKMALVDAETAPLAIARAIVKTKHENVLDRRTTKK